HPPHRLSAVPDYTPHWRRPVRTDGASPTSRIQITEPTPDLRLLQDPEAPANHSTLALRATVNPPTEQLVWYVDGTPFAVVDYPYTVRWPLTPGRHSIQARLPFVESSSSVVDVLVY
ncbi:MAG: hypothetical protein GY906_26290, partial [bacterium]|nr:hypothetical protein [bacterium]